MEADDIQKACRVGDLAMLEQAIAAAPESVNSTDRKLGWSPLYRAVICSHYLIARTLLDHGANPDQRNKLGETPLHQAADSGLTEFVQLLLDHNANPSPQQNGQFHSDGDSPLHRAAGKGHIRVCELLLDFRADVNIQNHTVCLTQLARTPLHVAVEFSQGAVVRLLLSRGADRDLKDMTGKVPVDLAKTLEIAHCFDGEAEVLPEESENLLVLTESPSPKASYVPPSASKPLDLVPQKLLTVPTAPERPSDSVVVVDLNRTFSFGNDTRRSQLLEWLMQYRLESLLEVLIDAGFDDVDLLVSQVDSAMPLTVENLQTIGVKKMGHCVRLLAAVEAEARSRGRPDIKPQQEPILSVFECCAKPISAPGFAVLPSLEDWLGRLGLKQLKASFESAGYDDLESVLGLMRTKYALTEEKLLKEMSVQPAATRQRLVARLREDGYRVDLYTRSKQSGDIAMEKNEKIVACRTCALM